MKFKKAGMQIKGDNWKEPKMTKLMSDEANTSFRDLVMVKQFKH